MARTDNQKAVTAYLSLETYKKLIDFKIEQELKSDSQAIGAILKRFFASPSALRQTKDPFTDSSLEERIEQLEEKISAMGVNWGNTFTSISNIVYELDYRTERLESTVLEESTVLGTVSTDVPEPVESETLEESTVPSTAQAEPLEESADIGTVVSDVPSTIETEPSEESADISTVVSDVPSTVNDDPLEESADIGTVVSDVPSTVKLGERTLSSDSLFVICRFNTLPPANPKEFWYWDSSKKAFMPSLDTAVKYKSLKVASKQAKKIKESKQLYADSNTAGWEIKINTLEFFEQKLAIKDR